LRGQLAVWIIFPVRRSVLPDASEGFGQSLEFAHFFEQASALFSGPRSRCLRVASIGRLGARGWLWWWSVFHAAPQQTARPLT